MQACNGGAFNRGALKSLSKSHTIQHGATEPREERTPSTGRNKDQGQASCIRTGVCRRAVVLGLFTSFSLQLGFLEICINL